jgi:serine/threonine-protein kinase
MGNGLTMLGVGASLAPYRPKTRLGSESDAQRVVGGFELLSELGAGAMGRVFVARCPNVASRVALKMMRPELAADALAVQRFGREIEALRRLEHPNVIAVIDSGVAEDGTPYLVTELLDGETLTERLERGRIELADALRMLLQVESALACCHANQIVHRDLKPDNLFLTGAADACTVKILDFGIAKLLEDGGGSLTARGAALGTPCYMAPELIRGVDIDMGVDIYALGVIAYELFTGRLPVVAGDVVELFHKALSEPPPRPSDLGVELPAELEQLVMAMLHKRAGDRPRLPHVRATLNHALATI